MVATEAAASSVEIGLHLSSFDWPGGRRQVPLQRLVPVAVNTEAAGVDHIWMMDHLRQIPQVGPAWSDLLESYTTLS